MHIDHVNEEQTQELPVIEKPDDQEPKGQPQEEYPQATSDLTTDDTDPSEEGRQALHSPSKL